MSSRALTALKHAEVIVGYKTYVELIKNIIVNQEIISTGMTREIERCAAAIDQALLGRKVAVISSGDPGVYGMAGLILELLEKKGELNNLSVDIIPGITSATSAAARLGAPLMHDFAVISLSDLLTPWEIIEKRLEASANADFVIVLYNPASNKRNWQLESARDIILKHKAPSTPVGIVKNTARRQEEIYITDLENMLNYPVDMLTTVIIGNKSTKAAGGFIITPRGYTV